MESTSTEEFVELSEVGGKRGGTDRWQIPVAIASLLLGIAVSLQFRASSGTQPPSSAQRPDLIVQLRTVETENNRLSDELAATRERMAEIERALGQGKSENVELMEQFESARLQAGLSALKGPGIVIRMSDSPRQPAPDEIPYDFIVHDIDLSVLVNELWASGGPRVVLIRDVGLAVLTFIKGAVDDARITGTQPSKEVAEGSKEVYTYVQS